MAYAYSDNTRFLLATEARGPDYVQRYTVGEMAELFTLDQIQTLDRGETLTDVHGTRWTDMLVTARASRDAAK